MFAHHLCVHEEPHANGHLCNAERGSTSCKRADVMFFRDVVDDKIALDLGAAAAAAAAAHSALAHAAVRPRVTAVDSNLASIRTDAIPKSARVNLTRPLAPVGAEYKLLPPNLS